MRLKRGLLFEKGFSAFFFGLLLAKADVNILFYGASEIQVAKNTEQKLLETNFNNFPLLAICS